METSPLVSVLMPMRNAEAFVVEALQSILTQSYASVEVVVVDDGSKDQSRARVEGLGDRRIRVVTGPQRGIAAAFNCALAEAKGDIIMRCDADDRFAPGRIAHQVALLEAHPQQGAVCGAYRSLSPRGNPAAELCTNELPGDITARLLAGETPTHLCTFAMRAEPLRAIGGCREAFVTAEDLDLQLRFAEQARVYFDSQPVYEYRLHDASITHQQADSRRAFYEALARECRRERAAGLPDCVSRDEIPAPPSAGDRAKSSRSHLQGHLLAQAWQYHQAGQRRSAVWFGLRALRAEPRSVASWRNLAALAIKRPAITRN